ncbi:MAG: hypothetical protein WCK29_02260 [archaeon]
MENLIKLEQLPYARDLNLILNYLKLVFPDFPERNCQDAARITSRVTKLRELAGYFSEIPGQSREEWHAWNYDPERKIIVDLTGKQLAEDLPEIFITSKHDPRYRLTLSNTREARSEYGWFCEPSFLKDYYAYAKNPERFYLDGRKKIIRDLVPVSLDLALQIS